MKTADKQPERFDISLEELTALVDSAAEKPLDEAGVRKLKAAVQTLGYLTELVSDKATTLKRLRELLGIEFGNTEKTKAVLAAVAAAVDSANPAADGQPDRGGSNAADNGNQEKRPGHGRRPARDYESAKRVPVEHGQLHHGDGCPECPKGKVYAQKNEPAQLVRVTGQAPLQATVYELERLRCGSCGTVFTAPAPEDVGPDKYDELAGAMIAELKYGTGMPFNRLEHLEQRLGVPLPAATQWEIAEEVADVAKPAWEELIRQAAQGEVVHGDDTSMRVLKLTRPPEDERTGVFTTGVVSVAGERQIAVYFTGRKHAGENLAEVLKRRAGELPLPVLMCDASASNTSQLDEGVEMLLARCLAHGRRKIVSVAGSFPEQCIHVLVELGKVYKVDAEAKERKLTPAQRLQLHQEQSQPVMEELEKWMNRQFAERLVEPNSGLGKAITYLQRHWKGLTLFLRQEGAPLDNNLVERVLKKAVLHRKNALYYRTIHGAEVGDLFMSLIETCRLNGVNSFDYLVELQRHAAELLARPADWMPWNYRATMEARAAAH